MGLMGSDGPVGCPGRPGHDLYEEMRKRGYAGTSAELYDTVHAEVLNTRVPVYTPTTYDKVSRVCSALIIFISLLLFMLLLVDNQARISALERDNNDLRQYLAQQYILRHPEDTFIPGDAE